MFIINDPENTLFFQLGNWFYSYFIIEKAHAVKRWGREGLWIRSGYICRNSALV